MVCLPRHSTDQPNPMVGSVRRSKAWSRNMPKPSSLSRNSVLHIESAILDVHQGREPRNIHVDGCFREHQQWLILPTKPTRYVGSDSHEPHTTKVIKEDVIISLPNVSGINLSVENIALFVPAPPAREWVRRTPQTDIALNSIRAFSPHWMSSSTNFSSPSQSESETEYVSA